MAQFGGFGTALAVALAALLVLFLSLFSGTFGAVMAVLVSRLGRRALLVAPAVWVATELARTLFGGGFPWTLVGYTQVPVLPVAQFASLVGVYGLSALVVLGERGARVRGAATGARGGWRAVAVVALRGGRRSRSGASARIARRPPAPERRRRSASDWSRGTSRRTRSGSPTLEDEILDRYLRLSREAIRRGAHARALARVVDAVLLRGARHGGSASAGWPRETRHVAAHRQRPDRARAGRRVSYNAAFLVRPDGRTGGRLPQDAPRAVRRVRAAQAPAVLRRAARRERSSDFSPGQEPVTAAGRGRPAPEHRDLLRGGLPGPDSRRSCSAAASC